MRINFGERHAARAWNETLRSVSIWKRSRLDHQRQPRPTGRDRTWVRETWFQQSWHEFECTLFGCGNSGRSGFASVSIKHPEFSEFFWQFHARTGNEIGKRNFVLPFACAFIESSLLSRQRLTLTTCSV